MRSALLCHLPLWSLKLTSVTHTIVAKSKFKEKTIVPATPELVLHPPEHIRSPQLNQIALTQQLRDGWYPIGFGFSTLVPAVVRSWEPVLAVLDSMKLVHLGSCVQDEGLLIEGRKRFLVAMNCLRSNLGRDPSLALPGLMLVSIGISMTEVSSTKLRVSSAVFVFLTAMPVNGQIFVS